MNEKQGKLSALYAVLLAVMLLAMPFLIPSGAVMLAAEQAYMDNVPLIFEDVGEDEFIEEEIPVEQQAEEAPESGLLHVSASGGSAPAATALPVDTTPGMIPNPAGYTETSYQDESISVTMESREVGDSMFHIAHVKIAHASQLRTALAGPYGTNKNAKPSTIARNNNAVVAINGDFYNNRNGGYVIRQGQLIRMPRSERGTLHVLVIDSRGDFHILVEDRFKEFTALLKDTENPILQAFTFGPALIVDGAVQPMPESYTFNIRGPDPRAAIGQVGPLEYVMVVVDGRRDDSPGVTMEDLAAFMAELGCTQAFNLDGGNSATMIFNNAYYSRKTDNSARSLNDIIYFASAVDPATWQK